MDDKTLFDKEILESLSFEDSEGIRLSTNLVYEDPGGNLVVRPLKRDDYDRGYMELLSQLMEVGVVSKSDFEAKFDEMTQPSGMYYIIVIEDTSTQRLVASITLTIHKRFGESSPFEGQIQNFIVKDSHRGKKLGKLLILTALKLARRVGCHSLSLGCEKETISLYERFGFRSKGNQMIVAIDLLSGLRG